MWIPTPTRKSVPLKDGSSSPTKGGFFGIGSSNMTMGDVRMDTSRPTTSKKPGSNLALWEREHINNPEVKRKATVAQLCEHVNCTSEEHSLSFRIRFLGLLLPNTGIHCSTEGKTSPV